MKPGYAWQLTLDDGGGFTWQSKDWVAKSCPENIPMTRQFRERIDELSIDGWFHLEQLTKRRYQLELGRYRLDIHIAKNGRVTVTAGGHELSSYGVAKDD